MPTRNTRRNTGTTLIELLVALAIAGIVVSLGFTTYGKVTGEFRRQTILADDLYSKIIAKKRIDRVCASISAVHHCTDREVKGSSAITDSMVTLRYSGNALVNGLDTVTGNLQQFTFLLTENTRDRKDRTAVLLWEGTLQSGGWIGGAVAVKKE